MEDSATAIVAGSKKKETIESKLHSKQLSQGEDQGLAAVCFDDCYVRTTSYAFTSRMRSQATSINWTASSNISLDFAIQHQTSYSCYATLFLLHHARFASLRRPDAPSASTHASTPIPPSARQLGGIYTEEAKKLSNPTTRCLATTRHATLQYTITTP